MIEWISQPWPWYVSGPLIALIMIVLMFFGKRFGVSSNLDTLCSLAGAGKVADHFNFDWKKNSWNLVFIGGAMIGGYISQKFLSDGSVMQLSEATLAALKSLSIDVAVSELAPSTIFSFEALTTGRGFLMMIVGGVLVGFGTRYAGGCTSGHGISGLSNLEAPSLVAVAGFFVGGIIVTHLFLPYLLTL